ncbi:OpgC domain-containing protein [Acuticoccus sp. MNP-M23]|uniref:OpgC family protein n=1 Tax=Acuticoccus sp. MNP-M23 TaxID=3072793 RepID=UPI0028157844|nr:OpgC domain-containing protein [Acuticoccus sp. MNP-M23]WMS41023.1 OpgC domain-containing protein [Acuticoccus sp. MNP-M23]
MTTVSPAPAKAPTKKPRDLRLDFFRGLGMYIIFVAHMPGNPWTLWIPARFGASDATEIFVFCSGMASAIAFGSVFRDRSWWLGTARAAFRVWQVYWAHIALFLVTVTLLVVMDRLEGSENFYTNRLYVRPFFEDTASHLVALMTLQYVPNYFDILPMYLVLLAMMPVVAGVGLYNRWLVFALMAVVWLGAQFGFLHFGAEVRPGNDREWFFNPFGWQLVFFTGFSFMMGWIKAPPFRWWLVALSIAVLVFNFFVASRWGWQMSPLIYDFRDATWQLLNKTDQGLYRFTHFLALAYLAYVAAGEGGRRLAGTGVWAGFVKVVRKVGQQSLAVFLASMVLAQLFGALLDVTGRNVLTIPLVNLCGFLVLTGVAYGTGWFKSQPWRRAPQPVDSVRDERRQAEALAMQPSGTGGGPPA